MNHVVVDVSSDEEDEGLMDSKGNGCPKSDPKVEVEDGDDDCVVLDGDPYKTKEPALDSCETDDVRVLGQKGEIACRDFPHPRHACAKYPFNSSLHQNYCDKCHCYVCDISAPCANWFMGFPSTDHCHANDKDKTWKNHRVWIRTVSNPRVSQPPIIPLPQNSFPPVTHFGILPCSASTTVTTHPNSYIRIGHSAEQSRTFSQHPGLPSRALPLHQNYRGGSYIGNSRPQVFSSNPYTWTGTPGDGFYRSENGMHNFAQGLSYIPYAPPTAFQGNLPPIASSYLSNVPDSQNKEYYRHFTRNMYSCNGQTGAVPSGNPNPLARQQQQHHQSERNNDKMLSEFEDWLMDNSTSTVLVLPLSGKKSATTFDLKTFLR